MIGTTISHFRVTSKLGEGGMGEVFRAEDTHLGRDVAIKLLPAAVARDAERLARFEREARVLASINHPNIAAVHELVEDQGQRVLVMEVAEGEDLAAILKRGPLELARALQIAVQIARGVEAAHERGVVHRDLKPANVVVSNEGLVKILDFGLAKALEESPPPSGEPGSRLQHSPTLTQQMTSAGVLLGTASYMSPEQARGASVDRRSDIWAFGCVLYEMLVGRMTFGGDTFADVLGAVVHRDPDLDELPAETPRAVRRLIEHCLRKDASRRLQSIGDARVALEDCLEGGSTDSEPDAAPATSTAPPTSTLSRIVPWAVAGLALLLAGWGLLRSSASRGPEEPLRRLTVHMGDSPFRGTIGGSMTLSPDGRSVAFVTGSETQAELTLRPLDANEGRVLARGSSGATAPYHPFFSPDSQWLGFVTSSELKKVSVTGGAAIKIADVGRSRGAAWGDDGTIVYAPTPSGGLFRISAEGNQEPQALTELRGGEQSHRWPAWLPGGKAILFTTTSENLSFENGTIEALDLESGERKELYRGGIYPQYIPTGHLLYVSGNTLFARPFDVKKLEFTGTPVPVLDNVAVNWAEGGAQYAVSPTGLLVYLESREQGEFTIVLADRNVATTQRLWAEPAFYANPQLSRDGKRLSVSVMRDGDWDVWSYDIDRSVATRLTFSEGYDADQIWSPTADRILFSSSREGPTRVYLRKADGSGQAELLPGLESAYEVGDGLYPTSWSADGRFVLFQASAGGGGDIWAYSFDEGSAQPFLASRAFAETNGAFSPDGRWVAYESTESGRLEVYIASFPSGTGKWQVSDGGAGQPRWSGDGKEIFFRTSDGVAGVPVDVSGTSIRAETPRNVVTGNYLGGVEGIRVPGYVFPDYDVFPNGDRFVLFANPDLEGTPLDPGLLHLVTGWFQEVEALTSSGR